MALSPGLRNPPDGRSGAGVLPKPAGRRAGTVSVRFAIKPEYVALAQAVEVCLFSENGRAATWRFRSVVTAGACR